MLKHSAAVPLSRQKPPQRLAVPFFFFFFLSLFLEAKPPQCYLRFLSHFLIFKIFFPILSFVFLSITTSDQKHLCPPLHILIKSQQQQHLCQPERQGRTKRKRDHLPRPRSADVPGPCACVELGRRRSADVPGPCACVELGRRRSADVPGPCACAGLSSSDPRALSGWPFLEKTAPPTFLLVPHELHWPYHICWPVLA